jgi:hypothetical protein
VFFLKKRLSQAEALVWFIVFKKNGGGVLSSTEMKKNKKDFFASY